MPQPKGFKRRILAGDAMIGCLINTASPLVAEVVAVSGYDFVMIDREHSPADLSGALAMVQAVETTPAACLMRVPANDPAELKRAADLGIEGVMVPAIESAAAAGAAAEASFYPPRGSRGMAAAVVRASGFGTRADYVATAADELLLICQIETRRGVANAAEIAASAGVDMLLIGPYDLSSDLGHPGEPDHPAAREAIREVERAVKASGKLLGGIATSGRSTAQLLDAGYDLVLAGIDVLLLREACRAQLAGLPLRRSRR